MTHRIARQAAPLTSACALLLLPATAYASGGWEGVTLLVGMMAIPILLLILVAQAIMLALKKAHRIVSIVTLIAAVLGGLWQLFWYSLELGSSSYPSGVVAFGLLTNAGALALSVLALIASTKPGNAP